MITLDNVGEHESIQSLHQEHNWGSLEQEEILPVSTALASTELQPVCPMGLPFLFVQ